MAYLEHKLVTKLSQKTVLTPGLVQIVSLLALNKLELQDMISAELVENPVLEEANEIVEMVDDESEQKAVDLETEGQENDRTDEAYEQLKQRTGENEEPTADKPEPDRSSEDEGGRDFDLQEFDAYLNDGASRLPEREVLDKSSFENVLAQPFNLTDHLEWQLGMTNASENVRDACLSIIGNLNEDGYLTAIDDQDRERPVTLEEIASSGRHSVVAVEKALLTIQSFDPPGVAARDLRECLLIQLALLDDFGPIPIGIVTDHLGDLQNRRYREIAKALSCKVDEVLDAVDVIKHMDPRPGQKYNQREARHIEPDVFIVKVGDQYTVVTNEEEVPQLRLSQTYRRMLDKGAATKEVRSYVRNCFKSAVQLLKNIEQRKNIIVKVCEAIVRRQTAFLEDGIDALKPMMIKDVAEEIGVHPSTVSRAVANKFAHTPQGVHGLRFFFSESVNGARGGNGTPLTLVKLKVKRLIDEEDPRKPLTDDKIAGLLKQDGISVNRRSITQYREDLKIPSTRQRRERS